MQTGFDHVLAFTLSECNARGRLVRLGPVLDAVISGHRYPAPIRHFLSEALVLTALLGSLLKEPESQVTLQIQSEGDIVDLLVCDFRQGELRGYVRHDPERLACIGTNTELKTLVGEGYLAITFDLSEAGERYQGIVPLEGNSLAEACESYFAKSEQVPTMLRVGIRSEGANGVASGLLVQHFPDGEEGKPRLVTRAEHPEWEHVSALASSIRHDELVDPNLSLEDLVWRLFHQEGEIRVEQMGPLTRGCRCTIEHFKDVLTRFPAEDRAEMRDETGFIKVDCAFCSKVFEIDA